MKVAIYYKNNDIRIEERPVPRISDNEILVKMMASGICGTDVMEWYRIKKAPRVLGHEMAGEIVEAGKGVERFKKGDRVFVSHHVPCYKCRYCSNGNFTACEALHAGNYDPGGFSEYIRVPEENVRSGTFLLPEGMTFEEAAMIEPLGCVIAGQKLLDLKEGQTVLIIGSGISGLLHLQMSKLKGAFAIATDIDEYRLEKAMEFGADITINANDYSAGKLMEINKGMPAERVIVCAGARQAVDNAVSTVDRKGKILFFAVPREDISLPSMRFWRDEISVVFSYGAAPEDLKLAIEMTKGSKINVRDMITLSLPLSRIQEGFNLVSEAKESLKVVIVPDSAS